MASGVFPSKWGTKCKECGTFVRKAGLVRFSDSEEMIGQECCGDQYDYWIANGLDEMELLQLQREIASKPVYRRKTRARK